MKYTIKITTIILALSCLSFSQIFSQNCSTTVTVTPSDDLANLVDDYPAGTCFYLLNGNYNFGNVYPKDNMKFTGQSRLGVQINGNGFENAFHGVVRRNNRR